MKKQSNQSNTKQPSGISLLLSKGPNKLLNKMPGLEHIYELIVESLLLQFKEIFKSDISVKRDKIKVDNFENYLSTENNIAVFGISRSSELNGHFMINLSKEMVFTLISLLLGGAKKLKLPKVAKNDISSPLTAIEIEIIKYTIDIILANLNSSFSSVLPLEAELVRLESDKNAAKIVKNDSSILSLRINLKIEEIENYFDILFPYSSIEPIKNKLMKNFPDEGGLQDPDWSEHFEKELQNTKVKLELALNDSASRIAELINFKIGHTIILNKLADDALDITINGLKVTIGKLGKSGNKVAVQLLDEINISKFNHIV
jgi:flagellar motor switch protein FliM